MSYLSLYRKWRPQRFEEVISQSHVTRTLQNALSMGRIAHAYLFCGPRGTGKTTVAKLFAKALNCKQGPTPEPCNECDNCRQIREGFAMDVIEIDGASNRGIDEIRDLREKVKFAPSEGQYKIYIIDEVHMLTTEAFNALLKTLEEPPAHVIFIFATTEAHKIPATILSRCQRFDFKRIPVPDLVSHLRHIAEEEHLQLSSETLALIARSAEGGLRDALSILDQCISFAGNEISKEDVETLLGTVDLEVLISLTQTVAEGDLGRGLGLVDELVNAGKDLRQLAKEWTSHLRNLLLAKVAPGQNLAGLDSEDLETLRAQAGQFSQSFLIPAIEVVAQIDNEMRWSTQGKLPLELAIIRLTQLAAGATSGQQATTQVPAQPAAQQPLPVASHETTHVSQAELDQPAKETETPAPQSAAKIEPPAKTSGKGEAGSGLDSGATAIAQRWPDFLEMLRQERLASEQALLREGHVTALIGDTLRLEYGPGHRFHMDQMNDPARKASVEKVLRKFFGSPLRLECVPSGTPLPAGAQAHNVEKMVAAEVVTTAGSETSATSVEITAPKAGPAGAKPKMGTRPGDEPVDEMVQKAIQMFGATLVKVE